MAVLDEKKIESVRLAMKQAGLGELFVERVMQQYFSNFTCDESCESGCSKCCSTNAANR